MKRAAEVLDRKRIELFQPVFQEIEHFFAQNERKIIAIEGRCASGKSTLAGLLQQRFNCNVIHMDDFFLPFELKTKERLQQAGGNIHIERFKEEVAKPLINNETIVHRPYNCAVRALDPPVVTKPNLITVIEGVYSLHPEIEHIYDYKIFLTVKPDVQKERLLQREGKEKLQQFLNQWIPMEEHYFKSHRAAEKSDIVIDTSI